MLRKVKKHKLLIMLFVLFTIVFVFYIRIIVGIRNVKINKYDEAKKYIDNNDYAPAVELLEEITPFRDSDVLIEYARKGSIYNKAKEYEENEDYNNAIALYNQVLEFSDSKDRIKEITNRLDNDYEDAFELAVKNYDAGDYRTALVQFRVLNKNDAVNEYISKCIDQIRKEKANIISAGIQYSVGITESSEVKLAWNTDEFDFEGWRDLISIDGKGGIVLGLSKYGKVYYSSSKYYQQEYGNNHDVQKINEWNDGTDEVVQIATGELNAFVLFLSGKVDGLGRNTAKESCEFRNWDRVIQIASSRRTLVAYTADERLLFYGHRAEDLEKCYEANIEEWEGVIKLVVGGDENPYVIGLKSDGTCVKLTNLVKQSIKLIRPEWEGHIADIAAGDAHTIVILDSKKVDVCGNTGIKKIEGKDIREMVWECPNPIQISAGTCLSLAVSENGEVYASGYDSTGQLDAKYWNDIKHDSDD